MWFIISLLVLFFTGFFDGHVSSMIALTLIFVLGFWTINSMKNKAEREHGVKVFGLIYSLYAISALIVSQSFLNGQWFYASDSMKYIQKFGDVNTWTWNGILYDLTRQYILLDDSNGLFNVGLKTWSYWANHYFDGSTVFYLTLFQTLFGVLAILEIYKLFTVYFEPSKAAKYACIFGSLSLFHIYSVLIIRDIVIAYFYMVGIRKVIGRPRITDGIILLFVLIITTGIRLYTGLFFGVFIMFWLYKLVQNTRYAQYRIIIVPLIVVGIAFVVSSVASSVLMESTSGQLEHYDELYDEGGGGVASFRSLPLGIRQIVTLLFTQLSLDKFGRFSISTSFSNYYLSTLSIIYKIFEFVIFYGLIYYYFIKGYLKKMTFDDKWLLIIMLFFVAITMSTHVDVRRSMEAVPFFYLFYMLIAERYKRESWKKVNGTLISIGVIMMIAYAFL